MLTIKRMLIFSLAIVACDSSTAQADHRSKPVVIDSHDLRELSPEARREVEALLARKRENPEREDARIRIGRGGGIVDGEIGSGGVDIRLLGGSIRIGDRSRRPRPEQLAVYEEITPRYRVGITGVTLDATPDAKIGSGVRINEVEADSPAFTAGLQPGDIVTIANEQPIMTVEDLFAITEASEGDPVELVIVREGREYGATLVPELLDSDIPSDLTITLTKTGNRPLHIHVIKGGLEFDIEGEQIEQLMAKYKPYIVRMLKNGLSQAQTGEVPEPGSVPPAELGDPATDLGAPAPSLEEPKKSLDEVVPKVPE